MLFTRLTVEEPWVGQWCHLQTSRAWKYLHILGMIWLPMQWQNLISRSKNSSLHQPCIVLVDLQIPTNTYKASNSTFLCKVNLNSIVAINHLHNFSHLREEKNMKQWTNPTSEQTCFHTRIYHPPHGKGKRFIRSERRLVMSQCVRIWV